MRCVLLMVHISNYFVRSLWYVVTWCLENSVSGRSSHRNLFKKDFKERVEAWESEGKVRNIYFFCRHQDFVIYYYIFNIYYDSLEHMVYSLFVNKATRPCTCMITNDWKNNKYDLVNIQHFEKDKSLSQQILNRVLTLRMCMCNVL